MISGCQYVGRLVCFVVRHATPCEDTINLSGLTEPLVLNAFRLSLLMVVLAEAFVVDVMCMS